MVFSRFLTILVLAGLAFVTADGNYLSACQAVKAAMSNASNVYYPGECESGAHVTCVAGNPLYTFGDHHFFASSEQNSTCVVEPGRITRSDHQHKVIGATKTPFAVIDPGPLVIPHQGQISNSTPCNFR